ncbi:unnamed protein product [Timema podura]|uniref:Uncharacterized protein n=1 Tax=Timema podura TaxID=61482 RepID=A0ABN7NNM4_TIMPD|nr:unnamed protein product [Timema podura]
MHISLTTVILNYHLSPFCHSTDNNDNNDITHRERARKREHPTDDEKIHKTLKTSPDSEN